jgi:enoyl-CoA hydratase/carnithine racemase
VSYETIRTEREGAVAMVTIDRPEKRNALNATVRRAGRRKWTRWRRPLGAGARPHRRRRPAFVAGADIAEFAERTPLEQRAR